MKAKILAFHKRHPYHYVNGGKVMFIVFCVIVQADPDKAYNVPFLGLSANKKLMLFPLPFLHQEAPSPGDPVSWIENTYASSKTEFPLKKWVHVGCEVHKLNNF